MAALGRGFGALTAWLRNLLSIAGIGLAFFLSGWRLCNAAINMLNKGGAPPSGSR
jgi:hypothetical protein